MTSLARAFEANSELLQLEAGLRAVIKRERIPVSRVAEEATFFSSRGLVAHYDPDWEYGGSAHDLVDVAGTGHTSLFVARDRGPAEEALALSQAEAGAGARPDASGRIGELLGYPRCCIDAWLGGLNSPTSPRGPAGIYLDAWQRTDGAFDPRLNRLGAGLQAISHRPCRYDCAPSIELADRTLAVMDEAAPGVRDRFGADAAQAVVVWSGDRWRSFAGTWEGDRLRIDRWRGPPAAELAPLDAALAGATALRWRPGAVEVETAGGGWESFSEAWPLELPWLFPFDGGPTPKRPGAIAIGARVDAGPLRLDRALLVGDLRRQGLEVTLTDASEPAPPGCPPDPTGVGGRRGRLLGALATIFGTKPVAPAIEGAPAPFDPVRSTDTGEELRRVDFGRADEFEAGLGPTWPVPGWTGGVGDAVLHDALRAARRHLGCLDEVGITALDPWPELGELASALADLRLSGCTLRLRGTASGILAAESDLRALLPTLGARVVLHGVRLGAEDAPALQALRRLHAAAPEAFDPFVRGGVDGAALSASADALDLEELAPAADPGRRAERASAIGPVRVGQALGKRWHVADLIVGRRVRVVLDDGDQRVVLRHAPGWTAAVEEGPSRAGSLLARVTEELLRAGPTPWPGIL